MRQAIFFSSFDEASRFRIPGSVRGNRISIMPTFLNYGGLAVLTGETTIVVTGGRCERTSGLSTTNWQVPVLGIGV